MPAVPPQVGWPSWRLVGWKLAERDHQMASSFISYDPIYTQMTQAPNVSTVYSCHVDTGRPIKWTKKSGTWILQAISCSQRRHEYPFTLLANPSSHLKTIIFIYLLNIFFACIYNFSQLKSWKASKFPSHFRFWQSWVSTCFGLYKFRKKRRMKFGGFKTW